MIRGKAAVATGVALASLVFAQAASAAPPVPFNPATPTVFLAQQNPTQLEAAVESNGQIVFHDVGSAAIGYNAIAYNVADDFIYGVALSGSLSGHIIRVGQNGVIGDTGIDLGATANVGVFGPNNLFYVMNSGSGSWKKINLVTGQITSGTSDNDAPDMAFAGGFFWGMTGPTTIQRTNPTTGVSTNFTLSFPGASGASGAAWTYGNGNVGFSNNATGDIYQVSIANPGAATPTFKLVAHQPGPGSSNNDGTAAPGQPTDLQIVKTATPDFAAGGQKITYKLTITNNGPGNSSGYTVNDTLPSGVTGAATTTPGCTISGLNVQCVGNPLNAGSSATATITVNAPNPFTALISNTATVTANEEDPLDANNDSSANTNPSQPAVTIKKSAAVTPAGDQGGVKVGDTIAYSYEVTNTGNVPLASIAVSDPTGGAVTCPPQPAPGLAIGAIATCTANTPHVVTQADVDAGQVVDTVRATGTDAGGQTSPQSPPSSVTIAAATAAPSVAVKKTADASGGDDHPITVGETIHYSYLVTNTGNVTLKTVSVDDPTIGSVTCPAITAPGLAPNASVTCTADHAHTVTQADVDAGGVVDTATGKGTDTHNNPVDPGPPSSVKVPSDPKPRVSIVKSAKVTPAADQDALKLGDTIDFSYKVTNSGNVTLTTTAVDDPTGGSVTCPALGAGLAPGASVTCTADHAHTVTQGDVDSGGVTDTATGTGGDGNGHTSPKSDPSTVHVPALPVPGVAIAKSADVTPAGHQNAAQVGDTIAYSYKVTNTGNTTLQSVAVDDPTGGSVTCPPLPAGGLAPGDFVTCTADHDHAVTQADVDAGEVTDTATASGIDTGGHPSPPSPPSTVTVDADTPAPAVSIDKSAAVTPSGHQNAVQIGDLVAYSYKVKNTGNVTLKSVAVDDPTIGGVSCPTPSAPGLAPGDTVTCVANAPHLVTQGDVDAGSVDDTATASGTDTHGNDSPQSAPSTASVPAVAPVQSVSVQKIADASGGDQAIHVNDTIQYSYRVTNTGNVTLESISVDDPTIGSVTCPIPPSGGLGPGRSLLCTADNVHTVTQQDVNNGGVTDTATATGTDTHGTTSPPSDPSTVKVPSAPAPKVAIDKIAEVTPASDQQHLAVGDTIAYSYVVTNIGDISLTAVSVVDPTDGTVTCPDISATLLDPGHSVTCTADNPHTVTQAEVDAGGVTDTATAEGTDTLGAPSPQSDPSSVTVPAVPAPRVTLAKKAKVTPAADQNALAAGDTIAYSYDVKNVGNVTLASVHVSDPTLGPVTCPTPSAPGLAPGDTITCTADSDDTVRQHDIDAGSVDDTAHATGTDTHGLDSPSASDTVSVPAAAPSPSVSVAKHATVTPAADQSDVKVGDTIAYDYVATNTGNVTLASVTVTDPQLGPVTCPALTPPGLTPGDSITCTADHDHTVTQADVDNGGVGDRAIATGTDTHGNPAPPDTTVITTPSQAGPGVKVEKTATVTPAADQNAAQAGDTIAYTFKVTNTGGVDLKFVTVTDPALGGVTCPVPAPPGLAPGDSLTCTGDVDHTVTAAEAKAGSVANTATATGTDNNGKQSAKSGPSTATVHTTMPAPPPGTPRSDLAVSKRVDHAAAKVGQTLTYTITVTNNGPDAAGNVKVNDTPKPALTIVSTHPSQGSCQTGSGGSITCALGTLANGAHATIAVTAKATTAGTLRNTATATSDSSDPSVANDAATATTKVRLAPPRLTKRASARRVRAGQTLRYVLQVVNPNGTALHNTTVCDTLPAALRYLGSNPGVSRKHGHEYCWTIRTLRAHGSRTITVVTVPGPHAHGGVTNRATAKSTGTGTTHARASVRVGSAGPCPSAAAADDKHPKARSAC